MRFNVFLSMQRAAVTVLVCDCVHDLLRPYTHTLSIQQVLGLLVMCCVGAGAAGSIDAVCCAHAAPHT